ncbi:MAG: hypothetical protein JO326_15060 [Acetobacteraceae bacterium]|nr:hypothetical protein [Acetobacteraceae bacterium]
MNAIVWLGAKCDGDGCYNGGASGVVSVPFTSLANAQAAQSAVAAINYLVTGGALGFVNLTPAGTPVPPSASPLGGVIETVAGGTGGGTATLPSNYLALAETLPSGSSATFQSSASANTTVIAGGGLNYINNALNAQVYFGGGSNVFVENGSASAQVNVDGQANVQASGGSTNVNLFDGAVLDITGGGSDTVNVLGQNAVLFLSQHNAAGYNTTPVAVDVGAGVANLLVVETPAFTPGNTPTNAFINPASANVTIIGSGTNPQGSVTVFGANSLTGGAGALTVFNANGYFVGGSGAGNLMVTSSIAGASTMLGGVGGSDTIIGFGSGDRLQAGVGANDYIQTLATGDTLVAGSGTTTMFGAAGGSNTFVFNGANGVASAYGAYGNQTIPGNVYQEAAGASGLTITINDFRVGTDVFDVKNTGVTITGNTTVVGAGGATATVITLSDATKITFNYANVSNSNITFG